MHAIVCHQHGPPEVMQYQELPSPTAAPGQVVIQAEAIGVNYVDTMRRSGRHPAAPATPFTPGIELCGRVTEVGDGVDQFQPGQRVIGRCVTHGTYAEQVAVEARFTVECPEQLPAEQAAALFVTGQTAYHALVTVGRLQAGESVLITAAAGGVGTCAVQIAKLLGAKVVAVCRGDEKIQLVKQLGADVAIDYSQSDWAQQVLDATNGDGVQLIVESVGGHIAADALSCWAFGGRMVVFGQASGTPATITGDQLLFGNRTVHGMAVGVVIEDEPLMRDCMTHLYQWHAAGKLHLHVGHTFPLRNAAEAHRQLESRQTHGKIVLLP